MTLLPMTISWSVVSSVYPAIAIERPNHLPPRLMATDSSASIAKHRTLASSASSSTTLNSGLSALAACFIDNPQDRSPVLRCPWRHTGRGMALAARVSNATVLFHGKRQVKMGPVELTLFAFAVGLTAFGLAGSAMELISGRRLAFVEPYRVAGTSIALAGCDRMRRPVHARQRRPRRLARRVVSRLGADLLRLHRDVLGLGAGIVVLTHCLMGTALLISRF